MNLGNGKSRFESFGEERGPPDLAASGGDQASGNRIEACVWKIQIHSFFKQPGNQVVYGKPGKAQGREDQASGNSGWPHTILKI